MMVGLNTLWIVLGSKVPIIMKGLQVSVIELWVTEVYEESVSKAHEYLKQLAQLLCSQANATALPLLCEINHSIPLINEFKIYL